MASESKDVKKQEELVKKQSNACLLQNVKKIEEEAKKVVGLNKDYFEFYSDFGKAILDNVKPKYPEFDDKFNPETKLSKHLTAKVICRHLVREGMADVKERLIEEGNFKFDVKEEVGNNQALFD